MLTINTIESILGETGVVFQDRTPSVWPAKHKKKLPVNE